MKYQLCILLFLIFQYQTDIHAQHLFHVETLPSNPTENDSIKIAYEAGYANYSYFLNEFHYLTSDTVYIDVCYALTPASAPSYHYDTVSIGVLDSGQYVIQLTWSGNNDTTCNNIAYRDTLWDSFFVSSTTSLRDEILLSSINIYPNPVKNNLTIETKDDIQLKEFSIQNIEGKTVQIDRPTTFNSHSINLNMESLGAGMYILILQTNKGVLRHKFVVQ